ncbi:MAG TPA: hypothetical protein VNO69_12745 [Methyloceanibacter sp.]|nr:hypothetical protein [Methyloceanibacter sp.]
MHGDEQFMPHPAMPEILSPEEVVSAFRDAMADHYRAHRTGINESTLTASDYLNHFHELVKLLDAVSVQLEEFAHEFLAWSPMTYEEHVSELNDDDLADLSSRQAPTPVRARFDEAVVHLHGEAIAVVEDVVAKLGGSKQGLNQACEKAAACLRILGDEANAIARGETPPSRSEHLAAGNVIYPQFGRR